MVTTVAQAILAKVPSGYGMTYDEAMGYARTAIEAMREPSEAMRVAGGLKCEALMFEGDGSGVIFQDMGVVFSAMVDEAIRVAEVT
jgi:hypothetical protein